MFALDPAGAVREIGRVLRPGGRCAIAVWGPRARNPWLGSVLDAVSEQLGMPVPPPGIPGPFSLDDADALAALFGGEPVRGGRRRRGVHADAGRFVRGMVVTDPVTGRTAHDDARRAARRCGAGDSSARRSGGRCLRDTVRLRVPRSQPPCERTPSSATRLAQLPNFRCCLCQTAAASQAGTAGRGRWRTTCRGCGSSRARPC